MSSQSYHHNKNGSYKNNEYSVRNSRDRVNYNSSDNHGPNRYFAQDPRRNRASYIPPSQSRQITEIATSRDLSSRSSPQPPPQPPPPSQPAVADVPAAASSAPSLQSKVLLQSTDLAQMTMSDFAQMLDSLKGSKNESNENNYNLDIDELFRKLELLSNEVRINENDIESIRITSQKTDLLLKRITDSVLNFSSHLVKEQKSIGNLLSLWEAETKMYKKDKTQISNDISNLSRNLEILQNKFQNLILKVDDHTNNQIAGKEQLRDLNNRVDSLSNGCTNITRFVSEIHSNMGRIDHSLSQVGLRLHSFIENMKPDRDLEIFSKINVLGQSNKNIQLQSDDRFKNLVHKIDTLDQKFSSDVKYDVLYKRFAHYLTSNDILLSRLEKSEKKYDELLLKLSQSSSPHSNDGILTRLEKTEKKYDDLLERLSKFTSSNDSILYSQHTLSRLEKTEMKYDELLLKIHQLTSPNLQTSILASQSNISSRLERSEKKYDDLLQKLTRLNTANSDDVLSRLEKSEKKYDELLLKMSQLNDTPVITRIETPSSSNKNSALKRQQDSLTKDDKAKRQRLLKNLESSLNQPLLSPTSRRSRRHSQLETSMQQRKPVVTTQLRKDPIPNTIATTTITTSTNPATPQTLKVMSNGTTTPVTVSKQQIMKYFMSPKLLDQDIRHLRETTNSPSLKNQNKAS